MRQSRLQLATLAALAASGLGVALGIAGDRPDRGEPPPAPAELANGCFALATSEHLLAISENGYVPGPGRVARFFLKPTGIGTYLLYDQDRELMSVAAGGGVGRESEPGPLAEWRIRPAGGGRYALFSTSEQARLTVDGGGELALAELPGAREDAFALVHRHGCTPYPEAKVGARGRPFTGTLADGSVFGFADAHMHISANLRAGGRVIHGQPFHRYGIPEALGHDEHDHGPNGSLDVTGNLLRDGVPAGTHDTRGWPTFTGWPVHDTYTHQQAYYVWLERVWMAGLRVLVAQAVEDEALCSLEPVRSHSCDETETVKLAIAQLRDLERYVDAQSGGRGRGWLRIVTDPSAARHAIERGKLAVLIGMETSSPFGCSEFLGEPQCTRADIDRVLSELHGLGVRSVFLAHWVDNAFSGAALQGGAQGDFISVFQHLTTGHPFATAGCGAAGEAGETCNTKGLTPLGRYLVRRMMARHMLIEVDHLSQVARREIFEIAERHHYPLVSSHTGTGGEWTNSQLKRLGRLGGIAAATPETAPDLVEKVLRLNRHMGGPVAFGSDTGGISALPGPADAGPRLAYPFSSSDGEVEFARQRTGRRVFDLNRDGVAHYGLFADLLASLGRQPRGERALGALFGSAEAYLRMWEQTYGAGRGA